MQIPSRIPGLKPATILLGIYAIVWISLEGRLEREIIMGVSVTAVILLHLLQKRFSGQRLSLKAWLKITAVFGLLGGLASGPLTLIAMIIKTGLHDHGPEFTLLEFHWVGQQIPLWSVVGLLMGIGLGMLIANQK